MISAQIARVGYTDSPAHPWGRGTKSYPKLTAGGGAELGNF